jgi:bifunctional UDP-N-acetylglucosamine pyrophosphorylase/glucosamine-1-phosphate N-acetyltransferase
MRAGATLDPTHTVIIAGHGAEVVTKAAQAYDPEAKVVLQTEQLGTGHAVSQAADALAGFEGKVIVLYGDTPFVKPETLQAMLDAKTDIVVLGFEPQDAGRYGRLVTNGSTLERIVEFKDASTEEREIKLCNSGVICCNNPMLFDLLSQVTNDNASGEYYLTDVIGLARNAGHSATVVTCSESETLGVNSRAELASADAMYQTAARLKLMKDGVTLVAPDTVYLSLDTIIGRDTIIEPNVVFGPEVTVESGTTIRAFSHLEGCHVSRGSVVGPYARLRPGAELSENVRIGNFVEVKNSTIADGAKVNHLSYIGDTSIGERSNIGAGTITCNYDGVLKHRTEIGADVFIGSNTMLVAPVTVGNRAMTGSGSVITSDVEPEALAIGRARQVSKPGMAQKLFDMLQSKKAKMEGSS